MAANSRRVEVTGQKWIIVPTHSLWRSELDRRQRGHASRDIDRPAIFDPSLASLSAEESERYAAIIDDIFAKHSRKVTSGDYIFETLQEKVGRDLVLQRHLLKALIIERFRKQPAASPSVARRGQEDFESGQGVTGTAAIRVSNISELLESILLHLPTKDLGASSLVNQTFHRLVQTAPKLQRKLFLLPDTDEPRYWHSAQEPGRPCFAFDTLSTVFGAEPKVELGDSKLVAAMNPLLHANMSVADRLFSQDSRLFATFDARILRSRVWPPMYLTNPPCTCAHFTFAYSCPVNTDRSPLLVVCRRVYDSAGVTFATLFDALHQKGAVEVFQKKTELARNRPLQVFDTDINEQLKRFSQNSIELMLDLDMSRIEFCRIETPRTSDFEEMECTGRVEGRVHKKQ